LTPSVLEVHNLRYTSLWECPRRRQAYGSTLGVAGGGLHRQRLLGQPAPEHNLQLLEVIMYMLSWVLLGISFATITPCFILVLLLLAPLLTIKSPPSLSPHLTKKMARVMAEILAGYEIFIFLLVLFYFSRSWVYRLFSTVMDIGYRNTLLKEITQFFNNRLLRVRVKPR